jgi:hypothetical protein
MVSYVGEPGSLVGSLFNEAFSVTRLYSVNNRIIANDDELERIW